MFIKTFDTVSDESPWARIKQFKEHNKLFEDVKMRIDALLAHEEITNPENSDLNEVMKTGLRVVQYRRINRLDHFDSEHAPPVTEEKILEKMIHRCASMSQCILEALCVAAGMTASTKEYLSVESEALMTALIYVLRVFCI